MRYPASWTILLILTAIMLAEGLMGWFAGIALMFFAVFGLIGLCVFAIEFSRSLRK